MKNFSLDDLKIINYSKLYRNLDAPTLVKLALEKNEGVLASTGALVVNTGKYNGRSPNDRYIVESESVKKHINWGKVNVPISEKIFDSLYQKMLGYMQNKDLFVFDGFVGADRKHGYSIRVINEL
ncbi:MAG: phosphoenolpyruvate carboxykinase (ATP), partial [bacterium]|nr:phosphoenolpyruvate carboxykinase (ATP) [bacterium]